MGRDPQDEVRADRVDRRAACVLVSSIWHAKAMLIAVSSLSPVSTHSAIPPRAMSATHFGTPSWSLSSSAVEPSSVSSPSSSAPSRSISFGSSRSFFSCSFTSAIAAAYLAAHASYTSGSSSREATTSVRRPSFEWSTIAFSVACTSASWPGLSNPSITESAPCATWRNSHDGPPSSFGMHGARARALVSSSMVFDPSSRTTTDIRRLADENSSMSST